MESYQLYKKIRYLDDTFLDFLYQNIDKEDIKKPFTVQDNITTSFVFDYLNNYDLNKTSLTSFVASKTNDKKITSKAYKRLYDIICSIQAEFIFCSVSPFAVHNENIRDKNCDLIYKNIEYDVKLSTASNNVYNRYLSPAKKENRTLTVEEQYKIANEYYINQLHCNTERNNFDSNKIHIILAADEPEERYKLKHDKKRISRAVKEYLNNTIEEPLHFATFVNPLTNQNQELFFIIIIVY